MATSQSNAVRVSVVCLLLGTLWMSCGPNPESFSRDCIDTAECGLARLKSCSTCVTHSFVIADARAAEEDARNSEVCLLGTKRCDGEIVHAECVEGLCEVVLGE